MTEQLTLFSTEEPVSLTSNEVLARIAAGRCLTCGGDLTANAEWFIWGDKGDLWCRACSAEAGVEGAKQ